MIPTLLGVPGKLKTLLDRLTATRAGYLDLLNTNLNATVSSRAAASTALTNATWTDDRAVKLDAVRGPFMRDPREALHAGYVNTNFWTGNGSNSSILYWSADEKTWSEDTYMNYYVLMAANSTWYTICDITGGGLLGSVVGPYIADPNTTKLRFTIDGRAALTLTKANSTGGSDRLIWNNAMRNFGSTTTGCASIVRRLMGYAKYEVTGSELDGSYSPDRGTTLLRFESALKIEVWCDVRDITVPDYYKAGAQIKRDGSCMARDPLNNNTGGYNVTPSDWA